MPPRRRFAPEIIVIAATLLAVWPLRCHSRFASRASKVALIVPYLSVLLLARAFALEAGAGNQYTPCFLCGIPTGALAPPGWYIQNPTIYEDQTRYDNTGQKQPIKLTSVVDVPWLIWVPDIPHVLGATYGVSILQPLVHTTATIAGEGTFTRTGIADTVLVPAILSWALPQLTFASVSFVFYVPDGTYTRGSVLNIGDNYWTFEPSAAVSYLANAWDLSAHAAVDVNTQDSVTSTSTGDILYLDLTATRSIGAWDVGVVGNWVTQFMTDIGPAAVPNERRISVGPTVSYQFGSVQLRLYFVRDIVVRNGFGGDNVWVRLFVPLGS